MNDLSSPRAKAAAMDGIEKPLMKVPLGLLALLTLSGTLAMHIFVPALPRAAADLAASTGHLQMTISVYIVGLAIGQLIYGPLSDLYGRRPVLMAGLALYAAAGLAAALAPSAEWLIATRLFQAMGGCAGLTLSRVIIRDTTRGDDAARRLASLNLMMTIGPALAPLVGGFIATALGWRWLFVLLSSLGILALLYTWRRIPETRPGANVAGGAPPVDFRQLGRNYGRLLASPTFLGYAIGGGCATTSLYAFFASAPFIYTGELQRPAWEVGIYVGILVSGVSLGSILANRLIGRLPTARLMVGANALSVAAALVFLGLVLSGLLNVWSLTGAMVIMAIGVGMASPAALSRAVSLNPAMTGTAAGLYGCMQMAVGATCTAIAALGRDPALAAALVLSGAGILAQTGFAIALRRQRGTG